MGGLSDRYSTALVTGASSGLGLAFTRLLVDAGIHVIGVSRSPEIDAINETLYTPIALDLGATATLADGLDALFERFPEVDLVINNAGYGILAHLETLEDIQIEAQYTVMLQAPTLIAARAIRAFKVSGCWGCLVNVSSLAVELPLPLMPIYNACKGGLSALSESLILDASGTDATYRVIDFRPGDFNTNFAQRMEGRVDWNGVDLRAVMDRHHADAPDVTLAVRGLVRALLAGRSGRVRVGNFFQAKLAPLGPRLLSSRWLRAIIRAYYKH